MKSYERIKGLPEAKKLSQLMDGAFSMPKKELGRIFTFHG
jgi:hypothetical protein